MAEIRWQATDKKTRARAMLIARMVNGKEEFRFQCEWADKGMVVELDEEAMGKLRGELWVALGQPPQPVLPVCSCGHCHKYKGIWYDCEGCREFQEHCRGCGERLEQP